MKTVILAEKPSQARAYVEALESSKKHPGYYVINDPILPANTVITFGLGHLVKLAPPEKYDAKYKKWSLDNLPIFPEHYQFVVPADKKTQFKIVQDQLKQAETIIVATDSDREGENIAWSIMNQAKIDIKSKTIKRLWINSLEKDAIRAGFKALKDGWAYYPAFKEAQTRQISDWLIGMNGSPLYSLLLNQAGVNGVYSIGRVQTPTLYMVYQRDNAIENFKPEPYLELQAEVSANQQKFDAKLDPYQRFKDESGLMTFMRAKHVHKGSQDGLIKDVQKQAKKSASPRLFSLSALQTMINRRYHASAADVLKAVQALYEAKYLSYPRTDSQYITDQEFTYLRQNLARYQKLVSKEIALPQIEPQSRYVNGKKVQEHHAIIMTKTVPSQEQLAKLSKLEQQVYDLVLRTTLAMFADPYEYEETTVIAQVGNANFKATGKVPTKQGWKILFDNQKTDEQEPDTLPPVQKGEQVQINLQTLQKKTTPPTPFTEGTLITAMKTAGRSLDDEASVAILKDVEGIGTEATRANILEVLKNRGYLTTQKNQLHVTPQGITLCKAVEQQPLLITPKLTAKWEKALKQIEENKRTQDNFLKQIKAFILKMINEVPTQFSENKMIQSQVEKQKEIQRQAKAADEIGQCPMCHVGKIVDKGKFYGCTNYQADPPCKFTLPKKWSGKTMGKTAVKQLITQGETTTIKGFKSKKTGKSFSAKLKLTDGKLIFNFESKGGKQ